MLQLYLRQFSQSFIWEPTHIMWVFKKFFALSAEVCSLQNIFRIILKKVVALPFVVLKLLLGKTCFTMPYERSKNQLFAVYVHREITEANWGCADIWWLISNSLEFDDVLMLVLWERWWFMMIDSAGLKKQEATVKGYNDWGKERLFLPIGLNMKIARFLLVFVHYIYYYQTWSHMAWLAQLLIQKLSLLTDEIAST